MSWQGGESVLLPGASRERPWGWLEAPASSLTAWVQSPVLALIHLLPFSWPPFSTYTMWVRVLPTPPGVFHEERLS